MKKSSCLKKVLLAIPLLLLLCIGVPWLLAVTAPFPGDVQIPAGYRRNQALYLSPQDGPRIAIDVWLPVTLEAGQKVPTVMETTRYVRDTSPGLLTRLQWRLSGGANDDLNVESFNQAGYVVVYVDAPGSGASFGVRPIEWAPAEIEAMRMVVDWIIAQPWSNGRVGAYGESYTGNTAEMLAVAQHPAVKAIAPMYSDFDPLFYLGMPGGVFHQGFVEKWSTLIQAQDANDYCTMYEMSGYNCVIGKLFATGIKPVDEDRDGRLLAEALASHQSANVYQALQGITYRDDPFGESGLSIEQVSPYGGYSAAIQESGIPMYVRVGWLDASMVNGALSRYLTFSNPQQLVIGPWAHGGLSRADPFSPANTPVEPSQEEQVQWLIDFFDTFLKDAGSGTPRHEISYYTMNGGGWRTTTTWPPAGMTPQVWYFGPDHTLVPQAPGSENQSDAYTVDFSATTGDSNRWWTQLGGLDVIYPDRADADALLLTYTSAPLSSDIEITGSPVITLYVSSTADDGAFHVYLEDVAPDGRVTYLTEGILRALHRHISTDQPPYAQLGPYHSFLRADGAPLQPGQVSTISFDLYATSIILRQGHCLRIAIAGADAGSFARYPAEGTPVLTFYRDGQRPSQLVLPVRPWP